jgi:hypothetical protein
MATKDKNEIAIELPDLGLTARELAKLNKAFQNELVATMGERETVAPKRKVVFKQQKRKPVVV